LVQLGVKGVSATTPLTVKHPVLTNPNVRLRPKFTTLQ